MTALNDPNTQIVRIEWAVIHIGPRPPRATKTAYLASVSSTRSSFAEEPAYDFRDFLVVVGVEVKQDEGSAQRVQFCDEFVKEPNLFRLTLRFNHRFQKTLFVGEYMSRPGALAAIEGNHDVERDPVHPSGDLAASVELSKGPPKLEHDFLRKVFP